MDNILSQEKINIFLDVCKEEEYIEKSPENYKNQKQITLFDFKRPNRLDKKTSNKVRIIYNNICKKLEDDFFSDLRGVEFQLHSVNELKYGEFLMSLPNPSMLYILNSNDTKSVLSFNPEVYNGVISSYLGGSIGYNSTKSITTLEQDLFYPFADKFVKTMNNYFYTDIKHIIEDCIINTNNTEIEYHENVVLITIKMIIDGYSGFINICYSTSLIEEVFKEKELTSQINKHNISNVKLNVEMNYFSDKISINEINKLSVGDFIEINMDRILCLKDEKLHKIIKRNSNFYIEENYER
jgi:flagellar motor switch protein FliM